MFYFSVGVCNGNIGNCVVIVCVVIGKFVVCGKMDICVVVVCGYGLNLRNVFIS